MTDLKSTAPTETANVPECTSPVVGGVDPSSTPTSLEWLAAAINEAGRTTDDYNHAGARARLMSLATSRATMRTALLMVLRGDSRTDIRNELALGMLVADGYTGELTEAAALIVSYHTRYAGAWQRNALSGECDCGGDRDRIPVWRNRCAGCGAYLLAAALQHREVVRW
jgi:hypothetical protein